MFYPIEIKDILKPAGLENSQDCVETFTNVGNNLLMWLSEDDKPEVAAALTSAAIGLKAAANGQPQVSGQEAGRIFRQELTALFKKVSAQNGCDGEDVILGSMGTPIRATLVLTVAPLDNNPIPRTIQQKARGHQLAEAALRFKGCFYWAGPSDVDETGDPFRISERRPGTIALQNPKSKAVFQSLGMEMNDGSFRHPVGGKLSRNPMGGQVTELNRNDFSDWLLDGHDISTEFRCNCWEAILISAWWADLIDRGRLRGLYQTIGKTAALTSASFGKLLLTQVFAFHKSEVLADHVHPFEGDIIFFNGPAHLAVATGNSRQVMSLWNQEDSAFEDVSIDFLAAQVGGCEVRYVPCPF